MSTAGNGSRFDWTAIRQRVEHATAAIDDAAAPSADLKMRVLRSRAKALAVEPHPEQQTEHCIEVVEFVLAYERYAVDSSFVREVHPLKDITALPGTPAFVAGIVNVRGRIVSVIDLKHFFGLPSKGLTDLNKVVILEDSEMEFGLLVDAVVAVHRLPFAAIQPAVATLTGIRADYLLGVTAERMIILNAARILADPTIICTK